MAPNQTPDQDMTPTPQPENVPTPDTMSPTSVPTAEQTPVEDATPTSASPEQPAAQPNPFSQPSEPTPSESPASTGVPVAPKSSKKRNIVIAAILAVVVLVAGGVAFATTYNNPDNVVADSLGKLVAAESGTVNGTVNFEPAGGGDGSVKLDYSMLSSKSQDTQADFDVNFTAAGKTTNVKATVVASKDNNAYVKVSNLRALFDMQGDSGIFSAFDSLVTMIDGKWVVITPEDFKQDEKAKQQAECSRKAYETYRNDGKQRGEIRTLYENNRFIVVSKNLGTETVNGSFSNHYELTFDNAKAKSFGEGLVETTVFKNIDNCYDEDLAESFKGSDRSDHNDKTDSNAKVELWVDVLSHNPTKLKVTGESNGAKLSLENFFKLGANPSVTVPKGEVTINQLKAEFEKIQKEMFQTPRAEVHNSTVLGVQDSRETLPLSISRLWR